MAKQIYLTGITTTGTPHLGNYIGAIRPAIAASTQPDTTAYYFLADYHALIKCQDPARIRESKREVAAAWLACGLNPDQVVLYCQSDIADILELTWILQCITAKGLMNRAHAYKAAVQENVTGQAADPDQGITMGLFGYPVLMAADILMFNPHKVPVGQDQIQHLEMTRDIAQRFNHLFGELFVLPEAVASETPVLIGLDGRKMSKTYNNTIPLFAPESKLRKLIMKIKTNGKLPGEPKDPDDSVLFDIYRQLASPQESETMREYYREGIGWGDAKQYVFEHINRLLEQPRAHYADLIAQPQRMEEILQQGAEKARAQSGPFLKEIKRAIGLLA